MATSGLNAGEKAALSQLARRLVDRGNQATANGVAPVGPEAAADQFSESGQLLRLLEIEKRIETIRHDCMKSLSAVLATVDRLEARVSRLDGEVEGLHDREEGLAHQIRQQRDELATAATAFVDMTATKLEAVLGQVDALLTRDAAQDAAAQVGASAAGAPQRG